MNAIKVLVVDDEPLAREILEDYISKAPDLELVGSCKNALDAFNVLSRQSVDLLLLDINMPEINGIEFIRTLKNPPAIIFTTAYPEFAAVSYDHNAIDYLLKPIPFDRFLKAIDKARNLLHVQAPVDKSMITTSAGQDAWFVRSEGKLVKIDLAELLFIEGLKDYLKLWLHSGRLVIHGTMKNAEEQLKTRQNFLRVNKSYIINLNCVSEVEGNVIRIKEHTIPIGNTYREEILQIFNRYKLL